MRFVCTTLISSLALAACAGPTVPETLSVSQPVIDGEDSPTGVEDSVVLIIHLDRQGAAGCTGTLIAPNLVLTALHCVAETDEASACDVDGTALSGGRVGSLHDAKRMYVFTGNERPNFAGRERPSVAGIGAKIFAPTTNTMCNNDIALLLLDRQVENAVIAPLRLDAPVVTAETITSVGWGITDTTTSPDTRQRRQSVAITAVGPDEPGRGRAIGPTEFEVGESICSGDSGGPAFASETGAVLGVVSRGGNGRAPTQSNPSAGCVGDDAHNIYTGVQGHRDLILSAFAEAGYEPWLENELNPNLTKFGEACTDGKECQQGVCVQTEGDSATCNLDCSNDSCPDGYECTQGDDSSSRCTVVPPPATTSADDDDEAKAGCSSAPVGQTPWTSVGLLVAAVLGSRRLRKTAR